MRAPNYNAMSTDELLTVLQHNENPAVQALVERLDTMQREQDSAFAEVMEVASDRPDDVNELAENYIHLHDDYRTMEGEKEAYDEAMRHYDVADADDLEARLAMAEKWAHVELTTDLQDEYQVERFYREHAED